MKPTPNPLLTELEHRCPPVLEERPAGALTIAEMCAQTKRTKYQIELVLKQLRDEGKLGKARVWCRDSQSRRRAETAYWVKE